MFSNIVFQTAGMCFSNSWYVSSHNFQAKRKVPYCKVFFEIELIALLCGYTVCYTFSKDAVVCGILPDM